MKLYHHYEMDNFLIQEFAKLSLKTTLLGDKRQHTDLSGDQSAITRVRFEKSKNLLKPWHTAPLQMVNVISARRSFKSHVQSPSTHLVLLTLENVK